MQSESIKPGRVPNHKRGRQLKHKKRLEKKTSKVVVPRSIEPNTKGPGSQATGKIESDDEPILSNRTKKIFQTTPTPRLSKRGVQTGPERQKRSPGQKVLRASLQERCDVNKCDRLSSVRLTLIRKGSTAA